MKAIQKNKGDYFKFDIVIVEELFSIPFLVYIYDFNESLSISIKSSLSEERAAHVSKIILRLWE
jgi:hypothetical protein